MSFLLQENFLYQSILFSWSEMVRSQKHPGHGFEEALDKVERPLLSIHFKEESISLCHPERSEGSLSGERSFAALRMTILNRLRLIRKTSSLKWIGPCGRSDISEEFQVAGGFTGFPAAVHVQLAVDALHLRFHRIDRDDQFLCNLGIGATGSKQAEHALLLWA